MSCLTLTALWSTHAHVFKRRVVNVHSKWDFPFIFCFIKWRPSFLHAIYYFVNDCTNHYYHLWHKTWNVGLCFIFTVKQHMPLNFNQKCLLSKGKKIYPPYVHLCIHIMRGCVYLPYVKHSTVYWPVNVQHMINSSEKWTGMLKAMPVHLPEMKVLPVHLSKKNIHRIQQCMCSCD